MPNLIGSLGLLVMSRGVEASVPHLRQLVCLNRHMNGDWGVVDSEDKAANDAAVRNGARVLSAYPIDPNLPCRGLGSNTLWIVTEANRSSTCLLLPDEY